MRVARLFLFADRPEKYFSGQSEGENSNASGTGSVRVSAQGLSRSCCKLSPMKIPSSRLAAPGSPRTRCHVNSQLISSSRRNMKIILICNPFYTLIIHSLYTTSCKKTRESPGCSSSLIGQKNIFLANQKERIQTLLELDR